jgi:hypothetical protein
MHLNRQKEILLRNIWPGMSGIFNVNYPFGNRYVATTPKELDFC